MKIAAVLTLAIATVLALPVADDSTVLEKRCGTAKRDEINVAVRSAVNTVKHKRELTEIDVDEISAALYSCLRKKDWGAYGHGPHDLNKRLSGDLEWKGVGTLGIRMRLLPTIFARRLEAAGINITGW
ncbi:hypothetical protein ASPNIDRAFT_37799 [Aspergillus niger ATCC 1015]|uniref:Uncharacterized protein n=1 Tax=Aspergillus niger (strain ATCC 1015 / CBS 113.46 / FGSC A1144 / LSHB Ac4 / NCTC 3858a / NRRL 328 / USDA 3528.7) TaxID=380704 RepID=G3YGB7_ASPNA|nr:uncharacterized protein BO96DRAFT_438040 [Aspergillus niger CBS 101883]EHA18598.1 hypothetical protein ASPNIDRAFT_37799 [Aspergillus niger ATCC 1015]PYH52478.1 hypothetical protein BO96DRAFT_438040 [Aspergillus niger CBS 101883]